MKENREDEILEEIIAITKLNDKYGNISAKNIYLQSLFLKKGFRNAVIDGAGNLFVEIPGKKSDECLIIETSAGLYVNNEGVKVTSKSLFGKNIIQGFSLYSLVVIGEIIKKIGLEHSVYLLASSEGMNEVRGTSFFLKNIDKKIKGFIDIKGDNYGKISTASEMILLLKIDFKGETSYNIKNNPIIAINNFISKIREEVYFENIIYNIGEVNSGNSFGEIPGNGYIKMEIRSAISDEISEALEILNSLAKGIAVEANVVIEFHEELKINGIVEKNSIIEDVIKRFGKTKGIGLVNERWSSEIVYAVEKNIDSVSIGIGNGSKQGYNNEELDIKSIMKGIEYIRDTIQYLDIEI